MNNRRSLQIHRCLLAIAITVLLANAYSRSPTSSEAIDSLEATAVIQASSPAE